MMNKCENGGFARAMDQTCNGYSVCKPFDNYRRPRFPSSLPGVQQTCGDLAQSSLEAAR